MKVICKGHKKCQYKYKCYHSMEHEFLELPINHEDFFKSVSKCETNNHPKNCNCSSVYLREEKLKKLNENK